MTDGNARTIITRPEPWKNRWKIVGETEFEQTVTEDETRIERVQEMLRKEGKGCS